jgi:type III pantothenate kinase
VSRFVADLGNSRLKWARALSDGQLAEKVALPLEPAAWAEAWSRSDKLGNESTSWAISSVNPPYASRFDEFLASRRVVAPIWVRAASEVPVAETVEGAETGGADRALAVFAATRMMPVGRPGLVILCGTAITVERITADGVWQGGAIAPGLGTMAMALHLLTAQLPALDTRVFDPDLPPSPWGAGTLSSLQAGIFWGTVGAVRELIARQADGMKTEPWVVWAGGDATLLARFAGGAAALIEPDLVLRGLAWLTNPAT